MARLISLVEDASPSLREAMVTVLDFHAARWLIDAEIPPQAGNDHPTGIPTGVFTTARPSVA